MKRGLLFLLLTCTVAWVLAPGCSLPIVKHIYQPDIIWKSPTDSAYRGENVADYTQESFTVTCAVGVKKTIYFQLKNNGLLTDSFTLCYGYLSQGFNDFRKNNLKIAFFDSATGGNDITDSVLNFNYKTGDLASGQAKTIRMEITGLTGCISMQDAFLLYDAANYQDFARLNYSCYSQSSTGNHPYQADLLWKSSQDPVFVGDNYFGTTTQQIGVTSMLPEKITVLLQLKNAGSALDTFKLTENAAANQEHHFFDAPSGGNDITTQVTNQSWTTMPLAPGQSMTVRLEITTTLPDDHYQVFTTALTLASTNGKASDTNDTIQLYSSIFGKITAHTAVYQPDAMVRTAADTDFVGDGVYTQATETRVITSTQGPFAFLLRVKNTATDNDIINIKSGGVPLGWTAGFFDVANGNADITSAVTAGLNQPFAAGATYDITMVLTPGSTIKMGASASLRIATTSLADSTKLDGVTVGVQLAPSVPFILTADPAGGGLANQPITLTATGLTSEYEYRFFTGTGNKWIPCRAYAATNTCTWTPTAPGLYNLLVWARKVGDTRDWEVNASLWNYVVGSAANKVGLSATPATGAKAGAAVTLSAVQSGIKKPEYAFYTSTGSAWTLQRPYAATASASWTPTLAGKYALLVYVREQGSNATYQLSAMIKEFVVAQ